MREEFYRKLPLDKISIRGNKNPIMMDLFMSFLVVNVDEVYEHLGSNTGWTQYVNNDINLTINGGYVGGVEYLDAIRYKKDLHNHYNNYVTPFNIFELLTDKGCRFFFKYFKNEIDSIITDIDDEIKRAKYKIERAKEEKERVLSEIKALKKCKI